MKEFIFLWGGLGEYGVFITREYFEYLTIFHKGKKQTNTFGEFWHDLGEFGRNFTKPFIGSADGEEFPIMSDKISDLDELWIFNDVEFPITQCVESTFTEYSKIFPKELCKVIFKTEYGESIGLFSISDFLYIKDLMENKNCIVSSIKSPYPMHIYDYKR